MEVLVILVPLALALGLAGLVDFLWSLKNSQYDDLEAQGGKRLRMMNPFNKTRLLEQLMPSVDAVGSSGNHDTQQECCPFVATMQPSIKRKKTTSQGARSGAKQPIQAC